MKSVTTNMIESLNYSLRKITKTCAAFPTEEAAIKLLYLGLQDAAKKWTMPIWNWSLTMSQMAILFEDRMLIPGLNENLITQNIGHLQHRTYIDILVRYSKPKRVLQSF